MRYRRQLSRYFIITSVLLFVGYYKGFLYNFNHEAGFLATPLGFFVVFSLVQFSIFAVGAYFIQLNFYINSYIIPLMDCTFAVGF